MEHLIKILLDLTLIGIGIYMLFGWYSQRKSLNNLDEKLINDTLPDMFDALFIINIKFKDVIVEKGVISRKFIHECEEIAELHQTICGKIYGVRDGNKIQLKFSKTILEKEKQIFRNLWALENTIVSKATYNGPKRKA